MFVLLGLHLYITYILRVFLMAVLFVVMRWESIRCTIFHTGRFHQSCAYVICPVCERWIDRLPTCNEPADAKFSVVHSMQSL